MSSWTNCLPLVLSACRSSVHESTHFTPFYLMYGRDPALPLDTVLQPRRKYMGDEYLHTIVEQLHKSYSLVKHALHAAREGNKSYYDNRAKDKCFRVGDPVYFLDPVRQSKFDLKWRPYYRIITVKGAVNYEIVDQVTGQVRLVHANQIKLANPDTIWDTAVSKQDERPSSRTQQPRQAKLALSKKHNEKSDTFDSTAMSSLLYGDDEHMLSEGREEESMDVDPPQTRYNLRKRKIEI